jgi:hypothetical protein
MTLSRGRDASHTATQAVARPVFMVLLATCLGVLPPVTAFAWLYPEHRDMTALAVQRLEPAARTLLEQLWAEARAGHEARLCAPLVEMAPGNPTCIDYAAWPAIAGDHACSARDLPQHGPRHAVGARCRTDQRPPEAATRHRHPA